MSAVFTYKLVFVHGKQLASAESERGRASERVSSRKHSFYATTWKRKPSEKKQQISYNFCAMAKRHNDANTSHTFTSNVEIGVRQ